MTIDVTRCWGELEREMGIKPSEITKSQVVYDWHSGLPIVSNVPEYRESRLTNAKIKINVWLYNARKKLRID